MLAVLAEFDHRTIVKRLHNGRRLKADQGGYIGGVTAYGKTVVGTGKNAEIIDDPVESQVVGEILTAHANDYTFQQIADWLNSRDVKTKRGKQWNATQVWRIVQRAQIG